MNKRQLHHVLKEVRPFKPRYFLVGSALSGGVSVLALRQNHATMAELRAKVYEADEKNGDVEGALRELRNHVHSHMNTDLTGGPNAIYPPIQLKYRYERLVTEQQQKITAANSQIYTDAQRYCEQQNPTDFSGRNRVPCIQEYVTSRGVKTEVMIPDGLYKFSFVSPRWSPDLAGWSMVVAGLLLVTGLSMYVGQRWLKRKTR